MQSAMLNKGVSQTHVAQRGARVVRPPLETIDKAAQPVFGVYGLCRQTCGFRRVSSRFMTRTNGFKRSGIAVKASRFRLPLAAAVSLPAINRGCRTAC